MTGRSRAHILIVEDEGIVAADIKEGLKSAGYDVAGVAASGREAIALAETLEPDLVLMDIQLQGKMTGVEAARDIWERLRVPVIYLTAHSDETTLQQAKYAEPFGYLLKPFGQRELRAAVEVALYKSSAEKKLAEAHRWNRLVIDTAHGAFIATDTAGVITDWSPRAEAMFGWKRDEAVGRPLAETIIPEQLREVHQGQLERHLESGDGYLLNKALELRARRRDGHVFPVELSVAAAENDGATRYLSFVHDISERKRLDLEQQRREALERSNRDLENFAHVTSHDLQEPLRTVSMYTELLARHLGTGLSAEGREYLQHVLQGTKRMRQLIDDLLSYARVSHGNGQGFEQVDVAHAVREALASLEATITKNGAKAILGELPRLSGHLNQLVLLFQNLIGNAVKFRSESPPVIEIASKRDGDFWLFSIRDNGIGFDPKYARRIFEMFQRLYGSSEYSGTGMGLAICKKIVSLHGGTIWAESAPGKGSVFYFTLPG